MMNIVLFGAPGAGKGTHAELLAHKFGMRHISTGDLLRAEVEAGTPVGKQVDAVMKRGDLVGNDVVIRLVEKAIATTDNGMIFDGFPRTVEQAQLLEFLLSRRNNARIGRVISIDMPREELLRRLRERAAVSGRADDNESTFEHRLEEYDQKTRPVLEYYRGTGLLTSIDGSGEINQTSMRICKIVEMLLQKKA